MLGEGDGGGHQMLLRWQKPNKIIASCPTIGVAQPTQKVGVSAATQSQMINHIILNTRHIAVSTPHQELERPHTTPLTHDLRSHLVVVMAECFEGPVHLIAHDAHVYGSVIRRITAKQPAAERQPHAHVQVHLGHGHLVKPFERDIHGALFLTHEATLVLVHVLVATS